MCILNNDCSVNHGNCEILCLLSHWTGALYYGSMISDLLEDYFGKVKFEAIFCESVV